MSRKRKTPAVRKPTGTIGHLSVDPGGQRSEFAILQFPSAKPEIEQFIVARVFASPTDVVKRLYRLTGLPAQNKESDFDFTLTTPDGSEYLDLMEVKPVGGRYDTAPGSYQVWEFAEATYSDIIRKSAKYGVQRREAIHLLLYTTDWRFHPDPGVLQLLTLWLAHGTHCFRTALYYRPESPTGGEQVQLFPTRPEERRSIDVNYLRNAIVMGADFSKMRVDSDGSLEVPLSPPPPGWRPADP